MKRLEQLKNDIENVEITYDYEESYTNLYNTVIDYMNEEQSFDFEYLFEDIISYDLAEERAKYELENGGLVRLYYFLGDANFNNDLFRINGYGNLEDINKDDLEFLKEQLLDAINEKLESKEG